MSKALYVEDNQNNINIMRKILSTIGYELVATDCGEKAMILAEAHQPEFILMDLHLPDMNGLEVTKRLKNNPMVAHIPVIALTADMYSRELFMDAGCDIYLTKPIHRATLVRTIHQVLGTTSFN